MVNVNGNFFRHFFGLLPSQGKLMIKFFPQLMNCQRHNLATKQRLSYLLHLRMYFKLISTKTKLNKNLLLEFKSFCRFDRENEPSFYSYESGDHMRDTMKIAETTISPVCYSFPSSIQFLLLFNQYLTGSLGLHFHKSTPLCFFGHGNPGGDCPKE